MLTKCCWFYSLTALIHCIILSLLVYNDGQSTSQSADAASIYVSRNNAGPDDATNGTVSCNYATTADVCKYATPTTWLSTPWVTGALSLLSLLCDQLI